MENNVQALNQWNVGLHTCFQTELLQGTITCDLLANDGSKEAELCSAACI